MSWSPARWRAVRALRREAQADALVAFAVAERALRDLERRSREVEARLGRLDSRRPAEPRRGPVAAGLLVADALAREEVSRRRRALVAERAELAARLDAARARLDEAQRAVGAATDALRRLEDLEPR
jgi:chromosome segregation ATPase